MSSGKVKCTCGWSWNKSDSSKKDMYICHECGRDNSNNMKNGGWLDNYNDSEVSLPEGYVGEGYNTSGRDYSPAWGGQFQIGGEVPKRRGVRQNPDGTVSTHLMATETDGKGNWFSFPTLFQNSIPYADDSENWVDMSDRPWEEAYEEAKKRGEVINFGKDKDAAIKFGQGSWKEKMQMGGNVYPVNYVPMAQKGKKVFKKTVTESTSTSKDRIPISSKDIIKTLPGTNVHVNNKGEVVIKDEKGVYKPYKPQQQPEIVQGGKPKSGTQIVIENKQKQAETKKKILKPLDVTTDVMQLGNFGPHPIAQTIGKIGNVAGSMLDAYQAYDAFSEGDYVSGGINTASVLLPFGLGSQTFRRNSKYLQPGQPLYPFSPQANLPTNASLSMRMNVPRVDYIEPFTKVQRMTDKSLLANRALLGTLGAETVYDTEIIPEYQMGGNLPGATGNMYARIGAPSNGKYAKKTMASAQEGKEITVDEGDGKKRKILTDSKEYADLFNQGKIGVKNDDESISMNPLNEVVVTPYDKQFPYYQALSDEEKKYFNSDSPIGRQLRSRAQDNVGFNADKAADFAYGWLRDLPLASLQAPQSALVETVEALRGNDFNMLNALEPDKQRIPSETWGVENPYAAFAVDALTDPETLMGMSLLKNPLQKGIRQLGNIKTSISPELRQGLQTNGFLDMFKSKKPATSFVENTTNVSKNLEDLTHAKNWAKQYGYELPKNLERIAQSDELTNRTVRGMMNRHNTFVRGVSTNWDELATRNPEILRHLEGKGFDLSTKEGTKQAAEYMATHVPIQTGYGRASLNDQVFDRGLDAIYTSNSIPTAEGYTYGQGYITKVKRPTDFSSSNRQDWITNNNPEYYKNSLPKSRSYSVRDLDNLTNEKIDDLLSQKRINETDHEKILNYFDESKKVKKDLMEKYKINESTPDNIFDSYIDELSREKENLSKNLFYEDYGNKILRTERKTIDDATLQNDLLPIFNKFPESKAKFKEFVKNNNLNDEILNSAKGDEWFRKFASENNYLSNDNPYAHYLHIGTPGEKVLEPIKSWEITPDIWKNKSRAHTNSYSKKLSAMEEGGIIKDDRGQWNHPGEITEINSNDITMQGVPYPVLGISDTGDTKLMQPGKDYKFKGKKVTEFPMAKNGLRQEQKGLVNLDQLTNFTNYNTKQPGGWMDKYQ